MRAQPFTLTSVALLYAIISASLLGAEWVTMQLLAGFLPDAILASAVLIGLAFAWITRNWRDVRRLRAAACAGLMFALLFGANLPFLRWLWPVDDVAATEFSWFLPFYVNVIWIGGSVATAFMAALLAQTKPAE